MIEFEDYLSRFKRGEDLAQILLDARAKREKEYAEMLPRLEQFEFFNDLKDCDKQRLFQYCKDSDYCQKCTGLPCPRRNSPNIHFSYNFEHGDLYINWSPCRYARSRKAQTTLKNKYGLSQLPAEYAEKSFDDYVIDDDNARAVAVARKIIGTNKGAYFYGGVGTGKTLLATHVAQESIKLGRSVAFITLPTLSMKIRSSFSKKGEFSEFDILDSLYKVEVLIVDDVGMEKPTRFICGTVSNIFNERYNRRLQTILTSNYTLKQLEQVFNNPSDGESLDGTRIYDRCKQMCIPVEMKGGSRR